MRKYTRPYVGILPTNGEYQYFRSATVPVGRAYPQYIAVLGPFRRAATAKAWAAFKIPWHVTTVAQAERYIAYLKRLDNPATV